VNQIRLNRVSLSHSFVSLLFLGFCFFLLPLVTSTLVDLLDHVTDGPDCLDARLQGMNNMSMGSIDPAELVHDGAGMALCGHREAVPA